MPRIAKRVGLGLLLVGVVLWALMPPSSIDTPQPPGNIMRGAYHIHTTRSDGSGSPDDVAAAAGRAGLHFVILTDHGDGTRVPDAPIYRHGVLIIDAVELNTSGGHYVALGLPGAPYPLAGTPQAVIEDVKRLGGFGIAAHPGSPRPSLQWTDWTAAIDGLEWINGDSEWRDEPRLPLARALVSYLFAAPEAMGALLDRPTSVLEGWDRLNRSRRVFAIAGIDAHARVGYEQDSDSARTGFYLPIPGYEEAFRTFSNHIVLDAPPSGNATSDAGALLAAIRSGRSYSVIDALASPGGLSFGATSGSRTAAMGDAIEIDGDVQLTASVIGPPGTVVVLLKDGERVHGVTDAPLLMNGGRDPAVYRVEAFVRGGPGGPPVPWIVSNPIYVGGARVEESRAIDPAPPTRIPAQASEAGVESGASDSSTLGAAPRDPSGRRTAGEPALAWSYRLGPGAPSGQFAALRIPITGGLAAFDRIRFRVSAPAPLRAWVQLRAPVGATERWGATFYADSTDRIIDLPLRSFAPIGVTSSGQPPLERVDSLLFVVDTLNFVPGSEGSMLLSEIVFVR
jgi:hypothetical protein